MDYEEDAEDDHPDRAGVYTVDYSVYIVESMV